MTSALRNIFALLALLCCGHLHAQQQTQTTQTVTRTSAPVTVLPEGIDSITTVTTVTSVTTTTYHRSPSNVATEAIKATSATPAPEAIDAPVPLWQADSFPATPYRNDKGKIVLATIRPELLSERVVVGSDTIPIILPQANYGRYDRGLFNFLFVPRGQWMFGLTASYGEFTSDDVQVLSLIKNFSFKGKIYSVQPMFSYFFRNNQSVGIKFVYNRSIADLGGLAVDFDDDMNFTLSDVSYYSQMYTGSLFYRNYVGLSSEKRFAIFNEVDLAFGSGSSRFIRSYDGEPRDTKTLTTKFSLNFSPGVTMYIMDNVCFNVSFGVFGLHVTHDRQFTDGLDEGSRTSSGANFRFNLFNINFGLGVSI